MAHLVNAKLSHRHHEPSNIPITAPVNLLVCKEKFAKHVTRSSCYQNRSFSYIYMK